MQNNSVKDLNSQLEGVIMGENEIARLRQKANDPKLIQLLDGILITVQKNKQVLVNEIGELGGTATYNEGMWGKMVEVFENFKQMNMSGDREILEQAINGTEMGFKAILDALVQENNFHEHLKRSLIEVSDEYAKHIKDMQEYLITCS